MLEPVVCGTELPCMCGRCDFSIVHLYDRRPEDETQFDVGGQAQYRRELRRCATCGHFISLGAIPADALYRSQYVSSTYGGEEGLGAAFERIMALDSSRSDNSGRVRRVLELVGRHRPGLNRPGHRPSVLDVGSGLCVFLAAMKAAGWRCRALDPDERAVTHARNVVQVDAVCADFMTATGVGECDLITINKVLEHVEDPVAMLGRCAEFLRDDGVVYIEVPDGEAAINAGLDREEFFIEHLHIFSMTSLSLVVDRAGYRAIHIERLREPSGKYTLWAFLETA